MIRIGEERQRGPAEVAAVDSATTGLRSPKPSGRLSRWPRSSLTARVVHALPANAKRPRVRARTITNSSQPIAEA